MDTPSPPCHPQPPFPKIVHIILHMPITHNPHTHTHTHTITNPTPPPPLFVSDVYTCTYQTPKTPTHTQYIDASEKGGLARFVNHACEPNCLAQKWRVGGEWRIGFFALQCVCVMFVCVCVCVLRI
jgi:hypothetical protein